MIPVDLLRTSFVRWMLIAVALLISPAFVGCQPSGDSPADAGTDSSTDRADNTAVSLTAQQKEQIVEFCSDCHAMPQASSFPKSSWHEEVQRGFNFYFDSDDQRLTPPVFNDVVVYFRDQAPDEIPVTKSDLPEQPERTPFAVPDLGLRPPVAGEMLPAIAGMSLEPIGPEGQILPVFCDMRRGDVYWLTPEQGGRGTTESIARFANPARAHACDLDQDGIQDLIIAEMGSEHPADHDKGGVIWMRGTGEPGQFESQTLLDKIGRVADVRSGDFDGDGDLDLIVGEFGYIKTGGIWLMTNLGPSDPSDPSTLRFESVEIDARHGTIHVPVVDFDNDGDLDFVALVSQAYESVELFANDGTGKFDRVVLYEAGDPAFGSSGIEVEDIDRDGDLDVLYVNGDTFDSYFVKPYHSIRWLENQGDNQFEPHVLADMPGAQHATLGDPDLDGDLDIIAVSLMPVFLRTAHRDLSFGSVIFLENDGHQNFTGTILESNLCNHASCALFDVDQDGDPDLIVSNFLAQTKETMEPITVWENQTK